MLSEQKATAIAEPPTLFLAWCGRTSTEDQQDPTLSLPRQLHNCRKALPPGAVIVAHFYDIESGRKDLEARGRGHAHERFAIPIPRDGGIQDLLAEAKSTARRFQAVICESIDRIARRTYFGTKIEHELEHVGVRLFAADEPILLTGKRATAILTRRVKQSVAEWYVLELLEKSWDGFCEHTRQGWNVGSPPYGYVGDRIPHPVPARRAEGAMKTRLLPDPDRAPVVHQIYAWRITERLGYREIADRLNADLNRYRPPRCNDPSRQRDSWGASNVRGLLTNPKYTGYMVWNRHARKTRNGKANPPHEWVWSAQPTHEPVVTKEMFEAAAAVAIPRQGSRNCGPNRHRLTRQSYRLRSYVFCAACHRRMFGQVKKGIRYYTCQPSLNHRGRVAERFPGHPYSVWLREDRLLEGIGAFFSERVFGAGRGAFMASEASELGARAEADRVAKLRALRRSVSEVDGRKARLIRTLETNDDPDGIVFGEVRERLVELEKDRQEQLSAIAGIECDDRSRPQDASLLDDLPVIDPVDLLTDAPDDDVRRLFDAFRLELVYDKPAREVTIRVTVSETTVDVIGLAGDGPFVTTEASGSAQPFRFFVLPPGGIEPPSTG